MKSLRNRPAAPIPIREEIRAERFRGMWEDELNDVFADVAPYYDKANVVASLGLWSWFLKQFMSTIPLGPGRRVLDVCAGTNAIGIALLSREPTLKVYAIDRSPHMQGVGTQRAKAMGFHIHSTIGDVHQLPFPDEHFDVVTLQFATRHLRVEQVFREIHRVLKPGGHFYHSDMLRPAHPVVEKLYHAYLRACLAVTGVFFQSGPHALHCKNYFIEALKLFYSAEELSVVLRGAGYTNVGAKTVLFGMLGFHEATKPLKK